MGYCRAFALASWEREAIPDEEKQIDSQVQLAGLERGVLRLTDKPLFINALWHASVVRLHEVLFTVPVNA